jgi:peptide/nickel transport system substrate-binding protein
MTVLSQVRQALVFGIVAFCVAMPAVAQKEFKLGDMIKPFSPPPLAELDKTADWQDKPVLDSLQLLREKQAKEKPLATVAEALKLKNDSAKANATILSALGRLPAKDSDVDWDATVTRHINFDIKSINPLLTSSTSEVDVNGLHGYGLFSFDWNFVPFAAKETVVKWQTSKDGLMDKVILRDDLTWSDGKPITAHDIVFSFKVLLSSEVPIPAQRTGTDEIKWLEAYDDYTLVYFHKAALATNVWNLNFSVIPKHVFEDTLAEDPSMLKSKAHVAYENNPVVGGPYRVASRVAGQNIVLERREEYYMHNGKQIRDKPYFKTIRFQIVQDPTVSLLSLKRGDIDELILTPQQWLEQTNGNDFYSKCTKSYATEWVSFHFLWNQLGPDGKPSPFFADKRVRQAMGYAFDHDELLNKLRLGLDAPATGIFHPDSQWAPKPGPKPLKQDLDKAEDLLAAAGWTDSDDDGILDKVVNGKKVKFDFTILVANRQDRIDICNLLRSNLDQIGIRCTVRPLEFATLMAYLQDKKFEASFGGWGTGTDPDTSLNIWGKGENRNYGSYNNPEVDKLFEQGKREFDPAKRRAIYQKIGQLIYDDQPYTWLFYQNAYYGFNKELRGYMFSPRGPYHYGPGFSSIYRPAAVP